MQTYNKRLMNMLVRSGRNYRIVLKSEAKRQDTGYYYKIKTRSLFHEACLSRLLHFVIHHFGEIKHLLHPHLYISTKSTGALHVHYLECFSVCFILDGLVSVRGICTNGHFSCFTIYNFLMRARSLEFLLHNLSSPSSNTNKNQN